MEIIPSQDLDVVFYSMKSRGFYPESMRSAYDAAGSWPDDAVQIPANEFANMQAAVAEGAAVQIDSDGHFIVMVRPPTPYSQLAAAFLDSVRLVREAVLNRLAGIGFAAMITGDTDVVGGVIKARQALLDITAAPAVVAASDIAALTAAVQVEYQAIISAAMPIIRDAFDPSAL
ncbi:hypothetical protein [Janthinobacterium sp. GMG1]|uniref:hypothetical protein n=1 Tax=Janthinobacterium sp. GMG1 TaxID=3096007 RepID=UPI002ACB048D|nr:hypothetical protein [Janthinobacterium sp. GMG1]MDZ5633924.1 hypothetical protein [Janthinobacterium sp. GMG1]